MRFTLIALDLKQNKIVFYMDKRQFFTYAVDKFLHIFIYAKP